MKATFLQSTDLLFIKSWCRQSQQTLSLDLEDYRKSLYTQVCVHTHIFIYMYLHAHTYICIYLRGT